MRLATFKTGTFGKMEEMHLEMDQESLQMWKCSHDSSVLGSNRILILSYPCYVSDFPIM